MANLQIKGIDDELYNEIKKLAAASGQELFGKEAEVRC